MLSQIYFTICNFIYKLNDLLWGIGIFVFVCLIGIYFTFRIKFYNFIHIVDIVKTVFNGSKSSHNHLNKGKLSHFQILSTALASSMGTGNIVGVAAAISTGGPGAIFWMWVSALIGTSIGFFENVLGGKFKSSVGGPMGYISKAFGHPAFGFLYAAICVVSSFGIGNLTQANALSETAENFGIPKIISAVIIFLICAFIVFGGTRKIVSAAEKLVPFAAIFYLLGAIFIIVIYGNNIIKVLTDIITSAFGFSEISGGICGTILKKSVNVGLRRGIFSNEAGMGSSVLVHSESESTSPIEMGMFAVTEVVIDTLICCTATAFVILLTGADSSGALGVDMVTLGFYSAMGNFSGIFVSVSVAVFAFCTLLGWYFFGEKCVRFIVKNGNSKAVFLYRILYSSAAFLGAVSQLKLVWEIADILNWFMLIFNLTAVLLLHNEAVNEINNYTNSIKRYKH